MLPTIYREAYETLLDLLLTLAVSLDSKEPEAREGRFADIRDWMEGRVLPLTGDDLEEATRVRWRRVQTELARSWRLLATDRLYLAASRGSAPGRLAIARERSNAMAGYCQLLLDGEGAGTGPL
jgi:hypothetical protein